MPSTTATGGTRMARHHRTGALGHLLEEERARAVADVFTALADPTRVRLVSALGRGEVCVGQLAASLGMTVSAVSHQLRLLRRLRTVVARREGRHVYYSLADEHIARMYEVALEHTLEDERPETAEVSSSCADGELER